MRLLIAFASYRRNPRNWTDVLFYEHDGTASGRMIGGVPIANQRSDYRPSLTGDGRLCAFAVQFEAVLPGDVLVWDSAARKLLELPGLNTPSVEMMPSFSLDGRWLAFAGWTRPGGVGGWDLFIYDMEAKKCAPLPGLNTEYDEQMPALSGDGRYLAFVSNRPAPGGTVAGLSRVYLYDRQSEFLAPLPGIEGRGRDSEPALSADGRYLAFASDRAEAGNRGGLRSIYLYDRATATLLPLPGLGSAAHDSSPALSADGRFLVFVSERRGGAGERDIYLYDRQTSKLLPTPDLNSKNEDFDPAIILLNS